MARRSPAGEEPFRPLLERNLISQLSSVSHPAPDFPKERPAPVVSLVQGSFPVESRNPFGKAIEVSKEPSKQTDAHQETVEKLDQEKRMLLTRREGEAVERLVGTLASRLNTQVKLSHVLRAMVALFLNAEHELDRRAGEAGQLIRPPNGDIKGLQQFEKQIGQIIVSAIRDAGPLKP
jgi:hypothetical protein